MADRITLDPRLGHALNRALHEGDVSLAMSLFAQYLANNGLKVASEDIDALARNGLIETH